MSSRVLPAGGAVRASPMIWRQLGGAPAHSGEESLTEEPGLRPETHFEDIRQEAEATGETGPSDPMEPAFDALKRIIQELAGTRQRFRSEVEKDTVELALAIARRILHRELSTDPEAILSLVNTAFQTPNAHETHRLRVSPSDAAAIEQNRARLDLPDGFEIVPDGSCTDGDAVFETKRGELDASIDTQLDEIQRGFAEVTARRGA